MNGTWRHFSNQIGRDVRNGQWDIVCLTETHVKANKPELKIQGYRGFHRHRPYGAKKGGGLAILHREELNCYEWEREEVSMVDNKRMNTCGLGWKTTRVSLRGP